MKYPDNDPVSFDVDLCKPDSAVKRPTKKLKWYSEITRRKPSEKQVGINIHPQLSEDSDYMVQIDEPKKENVTEKRKRKPVSPMLQIVGEFTVLSPDKKWNVFNEYDELIYVVHSHTAESEYDFNQFYFTDDAGNIVVDVNHGFLPFCGDDVYIRDEIVTIKKRAGEYITKTGGWIATSDKIVHNGIVVGVIQKRSSIVKPTRIVRYDGREDPLWILLMTMIQKR